MKTPYWNLLTIPAALSLVFVAFLAPPAGAQSPPMKFGMNLSSIDAQTSAGAKPDMGMIWIGPWTLTSGWGGPDREFEKASATGVTPVIQFYYWGDDISQSCLEKGCKSSLHAAEKNKANWTRLAQQLAAHLNQKMAGKPVIIIVESEFNKGDVATYEPLDGYLVEKADYFHEQYPASEIVMGLGNWGHAQWGTWDRMAAASDATGIQGMRASTKNSPESYQGLAQGTLDGAKMLRDRFHKPIYITDIALSTYPEPEYLPRQEKALRPFFERMSEFKALGVKGILYRGMHDSPNMDTANYFGEAERHWGLAWANNRTHKPSMKVWVEGVKAERGAPASSSAPPPPPPPGFTPTFEIKAPNEWWQEVFIEDAGSHVVSKVEVRQNGGAWQPMGKSSWGAWTSSINTKAGSKVEFLATSQAGAKAQSQPFTWLNGETSKPTAGTASATPTPTSATSTSVPTGGFAPDFKIKAPNEWWQEVYIENAGGRSVSDVRVRQNGGAWQPMSKSSWGAWTSSINTKAGSKVEFLATAQDGAKAQSQPFTWLNGEMSKPTASASTPTSSSTPMTTTTSPKPTTSSPSPTPTSTTTPKPTTSSPSPTATTAPLPVLVLAREAEAFQTKTAGAAGSDDSASAGQYWNLRTNGHIAHGFSASEGSHRVTVWAKQESFMSQEAPRMQVWVDGKLATEVVVSADAWTAYTVSLPLSSGAHQLRIVYTNDSSGFLNNRDLLLDRARIERA